MEKRASNKEADDEELVIMLRALRVEATPEAHFEERFLFEFHERLAQEAVSRPARTLLWEHLMQILGNFGRRRIIWGTSALGIGALCLSVLVWEPEHRVHKKKAFSVMAVPMPEESASSDDVVRTTVRARSTRKNYTERLLASRTADTGAYWRWVGGEDDADMNGLYGLYLSPRTPSFFFSDETDSDLSDLMLHIAR